MRRFCLQNVESILGDTKRGCPKTDSLKYKSKNQYYFIESSTAACAAARRAIGTRNGEQLA